MGNTLTIPGRYDKIQQACQFVAAGAAQAGLDDTAVFHVELACDEACTNVIEHAYGTEDAGNIRISWEVKASRFVITIHDNGRAFDPDEVPAPVTDEIANDAADFPRVGGLGVHFMRKLMDEVRYKFDQDGNTLVLVKVIQ